MIVYEADKKQFLHHTDYDDIENVILTSFKTATGKRVNNSEVRSWRESLNHIAMVLRDDDIPDDMGVAVELHIPQSSLGWTILLIFVRRRILSLMLMNMIFRSLTRLRHCMMPYRPRTGTTKHASLPDIVGLG